MFNKLKLESWRQLAVILSLLVMLTLILESCGGTTNTALVREPAPRLGYLAPDFELTDYNGSSIKLSDYKGKPVLINFWATWCPPCRAEMPEIEAAYRKYKKDDLVILGIDARENDATVRKYVEDNGFSWTMPLDYKGNIVTLYGVVAFPTSFFIDKEGFIQATQVGGMDKKGLEDRLSKILK